ncbi:hypothetical protein ACN2C6_19475 (plasmid) [Caulobacter sp. ErkDOM-YI]|uniref:hypothetical protein n=1 Tax=unclassified Caulobacter TaxID=2648921 RepID=UPI003AF6C733
MLSAGVPNQDRRSPGNHTPHDSGGRKTCGGNLAQDGVGLFGCDGDQQAATSLWIGKQVFAQVWSLCGHVHILTMNGDSYRLAQSTARRRLSTKAGRDDEATQQQIDPETGEILPACLPNKTCAAPARPRSGPGRGSG